MTREPDSTHRGNVQRIPTGSALLTGKRDDQWVRALQGIVHLPLPMRWATFGALALGVLGCAIGLVIGLHVYAPTAWAATFEIGIPSTILGALVGWVTGSLRLLVHRHDNRSSR